MAGTDDSWTKTTLWKDLKSRSERRGRDHEPAQEIIGTVQASLKKAERILKSAQGSPGDFTLHDQEHSFRVAERMYELVPKTQWRNMSGYEIALLLMAAYMHDIGMTPERKKVASVHKYLLTKADGLLSPAEAADLRCWLDEHGHDFELPLCQGAPTVADLHRADHLTAFYSRDRHNDWSAEWMRQHLSGDFHFLSDWKDALILLCSSHHFDLQRLRQSDFDPRPVGSQYPQRLHLRHLACILRVADILENDPERVPDIVFQHRDIASRPASILHWQTPHDLSLPIKDGRVWVSARPHSARGEKAIRSLADAIDRELAGCAAIADKLRFNGCPGLKDATRDWPLAPSVFRYIQARDGAYEFIEGAFRPNTEKLLQLLSGTQLYENPLHAVRELLQNAFDAVREKIARHRLLKEDPADEKWAEELGRLESVTLTLKEDPDGTLRLICRDTGVGMTKEIIERHLLVSGDGRRPALIDLERQCKDKGFATGRTGQFGIGVLSYFMMADEVSIHTCRDQCCHDNDAPGWTFTTHGVGDFGELRRLPAQPPAGPGTAIEWKLNQAALTGFEETATRLEAYLRETLIRIPCAFRFEVEIGGGKARCLDWSAGWTHSLEDIRADVTHIWPPTERLDFGNEAAAGAAARADQAAYRRLYPGWLAEARSRLRFLDRTFPLPDGAGQVRIVLPWFDLPDGPSLAFVCYDPAKEGRIYDGPVLLHPKHRALGAWKGMRNDVTVAEPGRSLKDVFSTLHFIDCGWFSFDLTNAARAKVHVNRQSLTVASTEGEAFCRQARALACEMAHDLLDRQGRASRYRLLSRMVLRQEDKIENGQAWVTLQEGLWHFNDIRLPCAIVNTALTRDAPSGFLFQSEPVLQLVDTQLGVSDVTLPRLAKNSRVAAGLGFAELPHLQFPLLLWSESQKEDQRPGTDKFPPEWKSVLGWQVSHDVHIWNKQHWMFEFLPPHEAENVLNAALDHSAGLEDLRAVPDAAGACGRLAALALTSYGKQLENMRRNDPGAIEHLFSLCAARLGCDADSLGIVVFRYMEPKILTFSSQSTGFPLSPEVASHLPEVTDPEWLVTVESE